MSEDWNIGKERKKGIKSVDEHCVLVGIIKKMKSKQMLWSIWLNLNF
jgi:hypothetical protein